MARAETPAISPFFIVSDVDRSIAFYRDRLGFQVAYQEPAERPFFAVIRRDGAQLLIKSVGGDAPPLPNPLRHPTVKWDAYVYAPDPDALAGEFERQGAAFAKPLQDTSDGQRGFEVADADGYILFFGRPR